MSFNWNNKEIAMVQSIGGVWAVTHPFDNLISTNCNPWPQPEIIQKMYKSRHELAFIGEAHLSVTKSLSYYCDLQSLRSEDAITWSVFGTLKNSPVSRQEIWLDAFLSLMNIRASMEQPQIYLWRRVPHPDTNCLGGPEIDVGIISSNTYILIECKWLSKTGKAQGLNKNKDQITLRKEHIQKSKGSFMSEKAVVEVIGIGILKSSFCDTIPTREAFLATTWEEVCSLREHPLAEEVKRYYDWKVEFGC